VFLERDVKRPQIAAKTARRPSGFPDGTTGRLSPWNPSVWRNVTCAGCSGSPAGSRRHASQLRDAILAAHDSGESVRDIAPYAGMSPSRVHELLVEAREAAGADDPEESSAKSVNFPRATPRDTARQTPPPRVKPRQSATTRARKARPGCARTRAQLMGDLNIPNAEAVDEAP
jgi:hypothetical protein